MEPHRNRLASESSAYLLQHASNPVDWYPWGPEALDLARRLDRPILLSIGYSACHWCHVMERESFENADIARLMNQHFVCIKVDREERPDIDHLYMKALQAMTGRGGWPMTMFLTPDGRPFYAGTYFPPEDRSGMAGFPRVLLGVSRTWAEKRDEVGESADRVVSFLSDARTEPAQGMLDEAALEQVAGSLASFLDAEHGGFGRAPKFPGTMALSLMMEAELTRPDPVRRDLVRLALDQMAAGGIRDHLGGGFHRYSVDRVWLVPHFEKMLYDQALLATLYLDAAKHFVEPGYAVVAGEILDYVQREMTDERGGFYSAQDADSEGEEGRFFVWTPAEIAKVLGPEDARVFCEAYGVTEAGNFEGRNILHLPVGRSLPEDSQAAQFRRWRQRLLEARSRRVPPATDRKIVADWNGLVISAMARAGRELGRPDFVDAAERAASFVVSAMTDEAGLMHVHAGGSSRVPAFLDDYAMFGRACLDLFGIRPRPALFRTATSCADRLLSGFANEDGGFWFTGSGGETLVARTCDLHDGAVPAGNSVAAELLLRLWALTGEERYRDAGQRVLDRFLDEGLRNPYGSAHLLSVAERSRRGWRIVAIAGKDESGERLSEAARAVYDPATTVIVFDPDEEGLPSALRGKPAAAVGARAYVCEAATCSAPVERPDELVALLNIHASGVGATA